MPKPPVAIRQARLKDVESIHEILSAPAQAGVILPLSRMDLYARLRDYFVCVEDESRVIGVGGLHICWADLAEIRSLVVTEDRRGRGVGRELVWACLDEARRLGVPRVFALTYRPDFFGLLGFKEVEKSSLPQKIWIDCVRCIKFPQCDEVAMIMDLDER